VSPVGAFVGGEPGGAASVTRTAGGLPRIRRTVSSFVALPQNVLHNVLMVTRLSERPVRRSTLPLTAHDLADLDRLRNPGPGREALGHLTSGDLPQGDLSESALLHAVFEAGLRAIRERVEELGYAEMAASETPEEAEEHRRILRRRRPPWADED
jgi:hypothetical protein